MSFSQQNFNQPPPGFGMNFQSNPPQQTSGNPTNVYAIPPPFHVPPPNFPLPSTSVPSSYSAPPPTVVPLFTAPPPNWNVVAPTPSFIPDAFANNHLGYHSNNQPTRAALDIFKFPPPPPQINNGYGSGNQVAENRQLPPSQPQRQSSYSNSNSNSSSYNPNFRRSSSSGPNNVQHSRPSSASNSYKTSSNSRSKSTEPSRDRPNRESRDSRDRWERSSSRPNSDRNDYKRTPSSSSSSARNDRSSTSYRSERSDRSASRENSRPRKDFRPSASSSLNSENGETERDELLTKWRSNYCEHFDDIKRKLSEMEPTKDVVDESWVRSSPSDIYYERSSASSVKATARLNTLCSLFESDLLKRGANVRADLAPYTIPPRKRKHKVCRHKCKRRNILSCFNINS